MFKLINIFIVVLITPLPNHCQTNLVENCGFENYSACPNGISEFNNIDDWWQPSNGTPDFFHTCATNTDVTIPSNYFGFEPALEGNSYVGLVSFYKSLPNYREYIETKLSMPTVKGNLYRIGCYISLADSFSLSSNQIGIVLADGPIYQNNDRVIEIQPSVVFSDDDALSNKLSWVKIEKFYIAEKGFDHLIFGNFNDDSKTELSINSGSVNPNYNEAVYYYIDSVFVIDMGQLVIPNVITPNNDGLNDYIYFGWLLNSDYEIEIYNRWGVLQNRLNYEKPYWYGDNFDQTKLSDGCYYYTVINIYGDAIVYGLIQLFK